MTNVMRALPNPAYYSLPFFVAFALSVVMLMTDTNLQTDFGAVTSGYYLHWYVVLGTAIADVVAAVLLLLVRSRLAFRAGMVGSGLLTLLFLGVIVTYGQVGFASASDFANYLFGITYFGGDIRYLYDALLAVYIATFLGGIVVLALTREAAETSGRREATTVPPAEPAR
jgi:hypothetical protein